ncbi:MAG: SDR family NAD(P)-dependent oxidoreductase [Gammaproteobacteria bacterium]|nr:SDR family NAD(P)-dependent oxidoreductase [Gammaproteobacteria bacterium]
MSSILITGSNRGIGLEWARQYAEIGWRVYATCRLPEQADALKQLAQQHTNLSVHRLDVTHPEEILALAGELQTQALDILVNNAGVYFERWGKDKLGGIDYAAWLHTYDVNVLGAMRVTEALRTSLARGKQRLVVMTTSHMGSIADIAGPNDYAYRSSKAALNATVTGLVHELRPLGIGILLVHPGWVRTRMGGNSGRFTVSESVNNMRELVENFKLRDSGRFYRYDGAIIPW